MLKVVIVLEVKQGCKCDNQGYGWNCQCSCITRVPAPICGSEEKQDHRYKGYDYELKDVCRRALVRLRGLKVPAEYCKQRNERQDHHGLLAQTIYLPHMHSALPPVDRMGGLPTSHWFLRSRNDCRLDIAVAIQHVPQHVL